MQFHLKSFPPSSSESFYFYIELCYGQQNFFKVFLWDFDPTHPYEAFIAQQSLKSTLPFVGLQHMQKCQVGRNILLYHFVPCFDPNEWYMKNGLLSGGYKPTSSQS